MQRPGIRCRMQIDLVALRSRPYLKAMGRCMQQVIEVPYQQNVSSHAEMSAVPSSVWDPCEVSKNDKSRRPHRIDEWAVSVRLNDGKVLFWCGEPGEQWGRQSQAFRFASQEAAERHALGCETNSAAWTYQAVRLPRSA